MTFVIRAVNFGKSLGSYGAQGGFVFLAVEKRADKKDLYTRINFQF
jgi:hypothetical protein